MKMGISYADSVLLPDTVLNEFIREQIVTQPAGQRILLDTILTVFRDGDYSLDSLVLRPVSVRWQYLDSVKSLVYMPESLWYEQAVTGLAGKKGYELRPSFFDYFRDTSGIVHLLLYPVPAKQISDTLYLRSVSKIANIATLDSLVHIPPIERTYILNAVTQQAMMYLRLLAPEGGQQSMRIEGFRGLNTATADFQVKANEARIAHNVDLGKNIGAISPRDGYDSVSLVSGMDSIVGIEGAYYSDGTQQLVFVADSSGVGYGNVYASPDGSSDLTSATRIWQYFSIQNVPQFAMLDDAVYLVNGSHKGIYYRDDLARSYPLPAPGEPQIVPLDNSGPLHGEYIYRISSDGGGFTGSSSGGLGSHSDGIISSRIAVSNGQVLLTGFQMPANDSIDFPDRPVFRYGLSGVTTDSVYWVIVDGDSIGYTATGADTKYTVRDSLADSMVAHSIIGAKVNVQKVDNTFIDWAYLLCYAKAAYTSYPQSYGGGSGDYTVAADSAWALFVHRTKANPGRIDAHDSACLVMTKSISYLDSLYPETLVFIDSTADAVLSYSTPLFRTDFYGRDSVGHPTYRYGAPRFVSSDTTETGWGRGIFNGWPDTLLDTLGVAYVATLIDTVTGIESDTSRSLFVFCDSGNASPSYEKLVLSLPKLRTTDSGLVFNIYRAAIEKITHVDSILITADPRLGVIAPFWKVLQNIDSVVVLDYYLLDQYSAAADTIIDSIAYDSIRYHRRYSRQTPPPLMTDIFSHDGRLFGTQKSGLYYSEPIFSDTLQRWGAMALTPINPGDGDMVTTAWADRGVVRVSKSHSSLNIYQDNALQWNRTEVSQHIGCLARESLTSGLGGHYYLTNLGVVREAAGLALDRTQTLDTISTALDNFKAFDAAALADARGFYFDQKYMLSIGDTTYVWDELTRTWSTWSLTFADATLYSTENQVSFLPGDSMYFIRPGDSVLYRFASSTQDNGTDINFTWQSGPIFLTPEYKRIRTAGVWVNSTDTSGTLSIDLYDESGSQAVSVAHDSLQYRHTIKGFGENALMYGSLLLKPQGSTGLPNTIINAIDISFSALGKPIIK
jgi:hypothetical protein